MKNTGTPVSPETQDILLRARQHQQAGRLAKAAALCDGILNREPRHAAALNLAGILAVQGGDLARGRNLLEAAAAAQPEAAPYQADLAQALLLAGEEAAAAETYRRCLALDPDFAPAWLNLGNLMLKADRIGEAGACFEKAAAVAPGLAEAHAGLGFVRQRQQRPDEAIGALERAAALNPRDAAARSNLGALLLQGGEPARAAACFRQAVALAPGQAPLHSHLGVARHRAEGPAAALAHYDEALALAPGDVRSLAAKGAALVALGRHGEARRIFDYEALLVRQSIPVPPGYVGLAAFNRALAELATGHPSLTAARPGKTTRGGGQTGELLGPAAGPMAALEGLIRVALDAYFADPARARHPHAPRRPARARLTAWATVLETGGHQDPHHHPSGVVSGVYYVQVPENTDTDDTAGAIEFGRPSAVFGALGDPEVKLLRPKEGLMVLFPSFFWHRTIPFAGPGQRISIAFDLIPQGV